MKKLKHFLKVEADQYDNVEIEWRGGHLPTAYFLDKDGNQIAEALLSDKNHGELLEWFASEHNFVPSVMEVEWGVTPDQEADFQGHTYKWFDTRARKDQAQRRASELVHNGEKGYLAVITSAEENEFVKSLFTGAIWLGGSDENHADVWKWEDGPESGETFYTGLYKEGKTPDGMFASWAKGEPNNANNQHEEQCTVFVSALGWNDDACTGKFGMLVEFGSSSQPRGPAEPSHDEL